VAQRRERSKGNPGWQRYLGLSNNPIDPRPLLPYGPSPVCSHSLAAQTLDNQYNLSEAKMAKRKKSDVAFDEIARLVAQAKFSDEVASELTQKMQQFRTGYRQSYLGLLHSARSAAPWHAISSALMNR
jgi:hypothetical protein